MTTINEYIEGLPDKNVEIVKEEILELVLAAVVASEDFTIKIGEFDGDWTSVLVKAQFNPNEAINDLKKDLWGFFQKSNFTMETLVDWLVWAVLCSPEFVWCAKKSGDDWLNTIEIKEVCSGDRDWEITLLKKAP